MKIQKNTKKSNEKKIEKKIKKTKNIPLDLKKEIEKIKDFEIEKMNR